MTRDPEVVRRADKIVVPGQGAFDVFMRGLRARGLEAPLRDALARGVPYLGICLGLQILFERSAEGALPGLGVFAGAVVRVTPNDPRLKVPHMGWNQVALRRRAPLLDADVDGAYYYFVHSYRAEPADRDLVALETDHGGTICAAIARDHVFACQFHPEKSGVRGLALLRRFVEDEVGGAP